MKLSVAKVMIRKIDFGESSFKDQSISVSLNFFSFLDLCIFLFRMVLHLYWNVLSSELSNVVLTNSESFQCIFNLLNGMSSGITKFF